jgi:hypothetical protein
LFEKPTKNDVFFPAGIIFGGHLKQITTLLILSELYPLLTSAEVPSSHKMFQK